LTTKLNRKMPRTKDTDGNEATAMCEVAPRHDDICTHYINLIKYV